jgi:monolysocardiolipin acyltransferase
VGVSPAAQLIAARDIMFTNSAFSKFFELGQVISTERGGGIFQPAIDQAIQLLQNGEWVSAHQRLQVSPQIHIFPEGKVNQKSSNPEGGLLRFKWGMQVGLCVRS